MIQWLTINMDPIWIQIMIGSRLDLDLNCFRHWYEYGSKMNSDNNWIRIRLFNDWHECGSNNNCNKCGSRLCQIWIVSEIADNWWFLEMCNNKPFLDMHEFTDNSDTNCSMSDNEHGSNMNSDNWWFLEMCKKWCVFGHIWIYCKSRSDSDLIIQWLTISMDPRYFRNCLFLDMYEFSDGY